MSKVNLVRGQDLSFVVRLKNPETEDPIDLSDPELVQAKFIDTDGEKFFKQYLPLNGTTAIASDIITAITTTDIKEGQPISGTGIPVGATVLKTPASTTYPTASGTIQISLNATANGTVALIIGDLEILSPEEWGKFRVHLSEEETQDLGSEDLEVKVRIAGDTKYKVFTSLFSITDRPC